MRALLDTHAFLWFIFADAKLKASAKATMLDPNNQLLLSVASLWEIVIKVSIGKLPLNRSYADLIRLDVVSNNIEILPITGAHLQTLSTLPLHHRDPFDRMIIAQALTLDCHLIGADEAFDAYRVKRFW
jgi:PIN domain nuclease of toxin-antitoxin system